MFVAFEVSLELITSLRNIVAVIATSCTSSALQREAAQR